jgi:very-short-patch-repair endonuclease
MQKRCFGENHKEKSQSEYDIGRTVELEKLGIQVIRFANDQIHSRLDLVVAKIKGDCVIRVNVLKTENKINSSL